MELRPTPIAAAPTPTPGRAPIAWLVVGLVVGAGLALAWLVVAPRRGPGADPEVLRATAVKLEAAGLPEVAAGSWEAWLDVAAAPAAEKALVADRLGAALVDKGEWERGLTLLYRAEALDETALQAEHASKVVHALEALGRNQAAKSALAASTRLIAQPDDQAAAPTADDPVVATIDGGEIRRSRVDDALAELPAGAARAFEGVEGREALLRQVVGEELLWRKAQRLEMAADPAIRRRIDLATRRLVVGAWLEREALAVPPTRSDLETFWAANRERYRPNAAAEPLPLEQITPVVEQDWRRFKLESAWRDAVERELSGGGVALHPERLAGGASAP